MNNRSFTDDDILSCRAYYQSPSSYPLLDDEDALLLALKMDPGKKLNQMETSARGIIEEYEHKHPINGDKITRRCLAEFEKIISKIEAEKKQDAKQDKIHLQTNALFLCIELFLCFKTMSDICDNNNPALKTAIDSFFDEAGKTQDFFSQQTKINYTPIPQKKLYFYEKQKYKRALQKFETALGKYNTKDHSLLHSEYNQLKTLKANGIAINFCSLVLNTAAQRLENPTSELYKNRLNNLHQVIRKEKPSTIMKYLPDILKFVGIVVAIVGVALLLPPSFFITQFGAMLAAKTSASTALTIVGGGAATFFMGKRLPSPNRYNHASDAIRDANAFTLPESKHR